MHPRLTFISMGISKSTICILLVLNITSYLAAYDKNDSIRMCKKKYDKTLKLLHEQSIPQSLNRFVIDDEKEQSRSVLRDHFEASGVELRPDGRVMYVIFDNTYQIGALCVSGTSQSMNCTDQLLDWPDESTRGKLSDFEGIAYNHKKGTYFIVQETIPLDFNGTKLASNIFEIRITSNGSASSVHLLESCQVDWEFESISKGFEGLECVIHRATGKSFLLALCEANNCSMATIQEGSTYNPGNGQIVVLEKREATNSAPCLWEPVGRINLPSDVRFRDYTALSVYRQKIVNYIAVTSQENSQLWIGTLHEINKPPYFALKKTKNKSIYNLPYATVNGSNCSMVYCTIEGVTWQNKNQIIIISDEAKGQHAPICVHKDQMIHYFALS